MFHFNIGRADYFEIFFCLNNHFFSQVDAINLSARPGKTAGDDQVKASPAAYVEDNTARLNFGNRKGVPYTAKGVEHLWPDFIQDGRIVAQSLGPLSAGEVVKFPFRGNGYFSIFFFDRFTDLSEIFRAERVRTCLVQDICRILAVFLVTTSFFRWWSQVGIEAAFFLITHTHLAYKLNFLRLTRTANESPSSLELLVMPLRISLLARE